MILYQFAFWEDLISYIFPISILPRKILAKIIIFTGKNIFLPKSPVRIHSDSG